MRTRSIAGVCVWGGGGGGAPRTTARNHCELCLCSCAVVGEIVRLQAEQPAGGESADAAASGGSDGEEGPEGGDGAAADTRGAKSGDILRWVFHRLGTIGRRSGDVARAAALRAFGQLAGALSVPFAATSCALAAAAGLARARVCVCVCVCVCGCVCTCVGVGVYMCVWE